MPSMQCSRCKHKINIPTIKYRLLGIGISLCGIFGWFSFLFAGSGHAFLIACGIVIFGIFVMYNAEEFAKDSLQKKRCPVCGSSSFEEVYLHNNGNNCIDVTDVTFYKNNNQLTHKNIINSDTKTLDNPIEYCPRCHTGILKKRIGRYGPFWGCSRYPNCRYTRSYSEK